MSSKNIIYVDFQKRTRVFPDGKREDYLEKVGIENAPVGVALPVDDCEDEAPDSTPDEDTIWFRSMRAARILSELSARVLDIGVDAITGEEPYVGDELQYMASKAAGVLMDLEQLFEGEEDDDPPPDSGSDGGIEVPVLTRKAA